MTVEIMNASSQYVDITPYIAWQGLTFSKQDVDGPDAGRTMDGRMHRGQGGNQGEDADKDVPLSRDKIAILQTLLDPETPDGEGEPVSENECVKNNDDVHEQRVHATYYPQE